MIKKKILMVCEAFGGGVFTYVSQLCNDMADDFDVYLAYSLRPQTPKNYRAFLNKRVHLVEMKTVGVKGLMDLKSDFAAIRELRQIEKDVKPDVIHLHSSVAGGLGRLAYKGKNNTVVYTPHGYAHILMGPGKRSKVYKFAEKILGNRALTLTCCESEDEEAKKAAAKVEELINKIGTVTSASKEAIEAAREAYEALSDEAKKLVSNLQILESAEKTYKDITSNEDTVKIKISQTQIKKIPEQIYTGKAKMPVPVITYQGKALIKGKDYQTAYSRNTNIGTAQVQITGIGNYTGTITESFQITVKKNTVHTVGNYKYKITDAKTNGKGTVTLTGLKNKTTGKKLKKITVAKTVSIGGKKFNITEIG